MALRNRVTPLNEIVADPARGLVYGNRGCLHDAEGRIRRVYAVRRWIACRLEFKGWRRGPLLQPGKFTELFFLDEATAFAAGHRPCALCRREDYDRFAALWAGHHDGERGADAIDLRLHGERLTAGRRQRRHEAESGDLPDGAFLLRDGAPWLVQGDALLRWSPAGYTDRAARPAAGERTVAITPPSLLAVLREGWAGAVPLVHPSAATTGDIRPEDEAGSAGGMAAAALPHAGAGAATSFIRSLAGSNSGSVLTVTGWAAPSLHTLSRVPGSVCETGR